MSVPTLSGGEGNIFAGWTSVHVSPSLDDLPGFHSLDVLYSSPASVILVPFLLPIPLPIFQFSLSELLQFSPKEGSLSVVQTGAVQDVSEERGLHLSKFTMALLARGWYL